MLHVIFVHAFGNIHVGLNLGQLDPLKDIESRLCEGPIYNRAKFEDKRDCQVYPVDARSVQIELVNQETAFADLWKANFNLISAQTEVDALKDVEELDVSVVTESVALVVHISAVFQDLVIFYLRSFVTLFDC